MRRIVVVGSGLVGSVLAVYLARRGHQVDVLERHADPRRGSRAVGRSINLTLCKRGLQALDRIGVGDEVRRLALPAYGRVMHATDGTTSLQPYGNRREAIHSVSRKALNNTLLSLAEKQAGVNLHFQEECISIDVDTPKAFFRHRSTGLVREVTPDIVFGADGAHSAVREALGTRNGFSYSKDYVQQGYREHRLPPAANGGWRLDQNAIHIWPRGQRMLIGFANLDGSFTLALHLPFEGEDSFDSIGDEQEATSFFRRLFPDIVDHLPRLAEEYREHPVTKMVTVRCSHWTHAGKVVVIGDAAHAIVPSYGQGANCGFEDCSVLADCLDGNLDSTGNTDWPTAFAEYENRREDADTIADLALEHFDELQEKVADPLFLLRKRLERRIEEICPGRYISLYSLVTFTTHSYREALEYSRRYRLLVDRLLALEGVETRLESGDLDDRIRAFFDGSN